MARQPTEKELKLAARANDLEDAALRPTVAGGGLFAAAANFLMGRVSRGIMTAGLSLFIAYHAWDAFNSSQQLFAELHRTQSEAQQASADAIALNSKNGEKTNAQLTLEADINKTKAAADIAQAEADAATHRVGDTTARVALLRAQLQQRQADGKNARLEADAALQTISNIPVILAQKRADAAAAEAEAKKAIAGVHLFMPGVMDAIMDKSIDDEFKSVFGSGR